MKHESGHWRRCNDSGCASAPGWNLVRARPRAAPQLSRAICGCRQGAPGVPTDLLASEVYKKGNPGSPNLHLHRGLVGASSCSHPLFSG